MRIRRLGVIGAGTMGGGIAALAASAGVPVILLDVPGQGADRNAVARGGVERAKKAKPAAFMAADRAALIEIGNTEDDLERLARVRPGRRSDHRTARAEARRCIARLEKVLPGARDRRVEHVEHSDEHAHGPRRRRLPVALRRHALLQSAALSALLEIIPTARTRRARRSTRSAGSATESSERASSSPTTFPGFVANRLGVFGMVLAIRQMEKHGLTIDEADVLTGVLTGRSKSATFRTADLSGIDVIAHVTEGVERGDRRGLRAARRGSLDLVKAGRVGEKSGAGFYRRVGKEIQTLDWKTRRVRPAVQARERRTVAPRRAAAGATDSPRFATGWTRRSLRRVRPRVPAAVFALRAVHDARRRATTFSRSTTRWTGATRGRPVRSRRWICSASSFWPKGFERAVDGRCRSCCAEREARRVLQRRQARGAVVQRTATSRSHVRRV